MGTFLIRVPDVGEGVAEAELVEWHVEIGQEINQDEILAAVMTDKATFEIPASASGRVTKLGAEVGETIAVGSELVRLEITGEGNIAEALDETPVAPTQSPDNAEVATTAPAERAEPAGRPVPSDSGLEKPATPQRDRIAAPGSTDRSGPLEKPLASPAVRLRALEAGIDLRRVPGSGPASRILHEDLDAFIANPTGHRRARGRARNTGVNETKVIGLRRKIAERMALSYRSIPHITIVEEVDMTALEDLRAKLNEEHRGDRPKLTVLPFIMLSLVDAVRRQPDINAHFDDEAGVLRRFGGVHVGIATQTANGLMVPVARHVEAMDLWACAEEIARLSSAARDQKAGRDELTGSTVTITSLGPLGALATTPIINYPEVAIVGVNRMAIRPHWDGNQFVPRMMMNISCSFDHRVIDGWEAAIFVQRLKTLLETPALIFVEA